MAWRTGDQVHIVLDGVLVDGVVTLASPNGRSLMLAFNAVLGGHVGMMPVLQHDDGVFRSLVSEAVVELTRNREWPA